MEHKKTVTWKGFFKNPFATTYYDPASIKSHGEYETIEYLADANQPMPGFGGKNYLSVKTEVGIDCTREMLVVNTMTFYSGNMGKGTITYKDSSPGKWEEIEKYKSESNDSTYPLYQIVCNKK